MADYEVDKPLSGFKGKSGKHYSSNGPARFWNVEEGEFAALDRDQYRRLDADESETPKTPKPAVKPATPTDS